MVLANSKATRTIFRLSEHTAKEHDHLRPCSYKQLLFNHKIKKKLYDIFNQKLQKNILTALRFSTSYCGYPEKEYGEATAKLEQYQHRGQRYENRIRYYTQGERKKRNHRLITRGGAVESIVPEVRGMSERAFFLLMEKVFSLPEVAAMVSQATDQQEGG